MDSLTKTTSTIHNFATNTANLNNNSTPLSIASTGVAKSQAATQLDFSNRDRLTDKKLLGEIAGSPTVEKLILKGCICLTLKDKTIRSLAKRLNHLKELDLSGCTRITDRVISCLKDSTMPLKKLVLDHIPGLNLETLRSLGAKGIAFTAKGSSFSECLFNLTGHTETVNTLIALSDGRLASGSSDKKISYGILQVALV
jgi:hypothetical protein